MDDVDREARLDAWFREFGDRVLAYLLHRTDPETAQDVLQEVFVTAFRKAAQVPEPPIGWLFGTARRLLANTNRGRRRHELLAVRVAGAARVAGAERRDDHQADDGMTDAVSDALAGLSTADREVLTLSAWYELSAREAAQALGCSPTTYAVRLHRARRRLADRLRADGFERPDQLSEASND